MGEEERTETETERQDAVNGRMGRKPVWKTLLIMGIPMIISLAVQSLYNIVDTMFVSMMPETAGDASAALTALGYAFPIQMIIVAVAVGMGTGSNVAISRAIGENNKERADRIAGNTIFCGFIAFALFCIFGATPLVNLYVRIYGSVDETVVEYTVTYLRICCCISIFNLFHCLYEKILQATGHASLTMIALVSGAVMNIILDPVFISVLNLGITGAAIATIIGQFIGCTLSIIFHFTRNREIGNSVRNWKPSGKVLGEIFRVGIAAIISQVLTAILSIIMGIFLTRADNRFFYNESSGTYVASYTSAYSTFYKVQQFAFMMIFGLRSAVIPVLSYNMGTGDRKRVRQTVGYGFLYAMIIMALCLVVMEVAARPLMSVFSEGFSSGVDSLGNEVSTLDISTMAARIIGISFLFAGVNIISEGVLQALNAGGQSLIIALCRQVVFLMPVVAVVVSVMLSRNSRDLEWLIWFAFVIAEAATAVISLIMLRIIYRKRVSPGKKGNGENAGDTSCVAAAEGDGARP